MCAVQVLEIKKESWRNINIDDRRTIVEYS